MSSSSSSSNSSNSNSSHSRSRITNIGRDLANQYHDFDIQIMKAQNLTRDKLKASKAENAVQTAESAVQTAKSAVQTAEDAIRVEIGFAHNDNDSVGDIMREYIEFIESNIVARQGREDLEDEVSMLNEKLKIVNNHLIKWRLETDKNKKVIIKRLKKAIRKLELVVSSSLSNRLLPNMLNEARKNLKSVSQSSLSKGGHKTRHHKRYRNKTKRRVK